MAETDYTQYGVITYNAIANAGATTLYGSLGSYNSVTGSGTITATDQTNIGSSVNDALTNAQNDYNSLISNTPNNVYSATDIGGMTFTPGTYQFTSTAVTLGTVMGNNTITLNGNGSYTFQFPNGSFSTDSTLANVSINLINGAKDADVFWVVNGNCNLQSQAGNITTFSGIIYSSNNIVVGSFSTNNGTLYSANSIVLNANYIVATNYPTTYSVNTLTPISTSGRTDVNAIYLYVAINGDNSDIIDFIIEPQALASASNAANTISTINFAANSVPVPFQPTRSKHHLIFLQNAPSQQVQADVAINTDGSIVYTIVNDTFTSGVSCSITQSVSGHYSLI